MADLIQDDDIEPSEKARLIQATQKLLAKARKRMRISCNRTKAVLVKRLEKIGVETRTKVKDLAQKFDTVGLVRPAESNVETSVHTRETTWTPHEMAHLTIIIADLRHFGAFQRLHQKPTTRAQMEEDRHDPWSAEFFQSFNSAEYLPERRNPCDRVLQQLLDSFDPEDHPHERTVEALRSKRYTLRARFTTCSRRFEKSGQGESDVFPDFAKGEPNMSYMHCVFKHSPELEMVMREVGAGKRAESEIGGSYFSDRSEFTDKHSSPTIGTKRKIMTDEGLTKVVESMSKPVGIKFSFTSDYGDDDGLQPHLSCKAISSDRLSSLLDLEQELVRRSHAARGEHNEELIHFLQNRLRRVRERIDAALEE